MTELLWMLPVLLILGVQIGLMMGFTGLSRKKAAAVILGLGGGLLPVTYLASGVVDQLSGFIQDYSSALGIILATILLYTGFRTLRDRKTSTTSLCSVRPSPGPHPSCDIALGWVGTVPVSLWS